MNPYYKNALIVGASSGVGRALGIELAKLGCTVTLAARDLRDLESTAQHIRCVFGTHASAQLLDLETLTAFDVSSFDALFITAGVSLAEDDIHTLTSETVERLYQRITGINMSGPARLIISFFLSFKARRNRTYIGVCSSIAAPVPRSRNLIYAAAKNGLESIVRSLQHAAASTSVTVQFFRLGYVDSSLSYGQKLLFPALSPEQVAKIMIHSSMKPSKRLIYAPFYWQFIVLALRALPWALFTKLRF